MPRGRQAFHVIPVPLRYDAPSMRQRGKYEGHGAVAVGRTERLAAATTALFVTFLWSTSWVLIKRSLPVIPPLTFAGLRFALAFLCLAPALWLKRGEVRAVGGKGWVCLAALGVVFYAATQGGQFLALAHLDATTLSLCLSMTAAVVAVAGAVRQHEAPRTWQWLGIAVVTLGAVAYFVPQGTTSSSPLGWVFAGMTVLANAGASILGRHANRVRVASPLVVTGISMGIGAVILLSVGLIAEGLPSLSASSWGVIAWLAVVNTALAFTLWNRSLRGLTAVESSVLNNTMLVQVAILAWAFLGETHGSLEIAGLAAVAVGTVLVQLRGR